VHFLTIALLIVVVYVAYVALGYVIGATLFRRYSSSWKSLGQNMVEFLWSFGHENLIGMLAYAFFWPLYLGALILASIPRWWRDRQRVRRMKNAKFSQRDYFTRMDDIGSLYPTTVIKDYPKSGNPMSNRRYGEDTPSSDA
jgi:hypothetical protein